MPRNSLAILCGAILMSGCAAQATYSLQGVSKQIPIGTRFAVSSPITYPADRDTLWFQSGEIVSSRNINTWTWHCSLDLHIQAKSSEARQFKGGQLVVSDIREEGDRWLSQPPFGRTLLSDDNDYTVGVVFALASPELPAIKALRCERRFQDWSRERHLTRADVQEQLGPYLTVGPVSQ